MNAKQYRDAVGTAKAQEVVKMAGTSWPYFKHIIHGRKRPSPDLAQRLVEASAEVTPEHTMSFVDLLPVRK